MTDRGGLRSAASLLSEGIDALARADAAGLGRLVAEAAGTVALPAEHEAVREQHRALARLLVLTRRNLRLLRGECGAVYGRNSTGDGKPWPL